MSRRAPLPPPPPPAEIRSWPDRGALLRDRALVLSELTRMFMGPGRLGVLWMWAGAAASGWSLVAVGIASFEAAADSFSWLLGAFFQAVGAAVIIPAVAFVAVGAARDVRVHRLLVRWGGLDRDPAGDLPLRMPRVALTWLTTSSVLCAVGLFLCFAVPAKARAGEDTYAEVTWLMGLGFLAWLTGLTGLVKARAHRRWVVRVLSGAPARPLLSVDG
ncbi:hypothetical protein AB0M42_03290 [Streptomyces sp. NPDC051784]|uniref:hypothetical protein n=1 Tax=Streptomyces sp. NPDC051784 TaxID=3155805 RepID=UPI003419707B